MADYYSILARAISNLPDNSSAARQHVYERARAVIVAHLRGRNVDESSPEALQEQAALDGAIHRLEQEVRSVPKAAALPPANIQAKQLSKVLQVLQADGDEGQAIAASRAMNAAGTPQPGAIADNEVTIPWRGNPVEEMRQVPHTIGAMLFGIAYIVAAMAFTGVACIRCAIWVSEGVIGYPIMIAVTAGVVGLFLLPPLALFRHAAATNAAEAPRA